MATEYTLEEVREHSTDKDCWVVVKDKVYDVTDYLSEHPGGKQILASAAGTDCTDEFEDSHFSEEPLLELKRLYIGDLAPQDRKQKSGSKESRYANYLVSDKQTASGGCILLTLTLDGDMPQPKCLPKSARTLSKLFGTKKKAGKRSADQGPNSTLGWADMLSLWVDSPVVGQHVMIKATERSSGAPIVRQYTPISVFEGGFVLLIKVYRPTEQFPQGGKMSQHLDSLELGDKLQVQGPSGHIRYQLPGGNLKVSGERKKVQTMGFICGGTGITPAFQVLDAALKDPMDKTKFSLLYANNSEDEILLREELDALAKAFPKRFKVWYTITKADPAWEYSTGYINLDMIKKCFPTGDDDECYIGLCGPPPMIEMACIPNLRKHGYSAAFYGCF